MIRPDAEKFLRLLFGKAPEDAAVVISALPSRDSIPLSADNVEGLVLAAERVEEDRQDAYFSVCCVGTDFGAEGGRGKKAAYRCGVALWADVDVRSPAHKAAPETLPPTVEDAADLLEAIPFPPTALVSSGHGLHAYWVLEEPVAFGAGGALSPEGIHFAAVVEALQERVRAGAKARGWHVDLVADVPRILRVPGTSNFKLPGDVRRVELLLDDGPTVAFGDAAEALGLAREPRRGLAKPAPSEGTPSASAAPSSPGSVEEKPVDLADVRKRLGNLRSEVSRRFFAPILAGESFAEAGDRDRALQRAASLVAFVEPSGDSAALAELFRPSFTVWAGEQGATRSVEDEMGKALEKLRRAQADARRKKATSDAANARIRRMMGVDETTGDADLALREPAAPASEGAARARASAAPPVAAGYQKFTEDEISAIAADLDCTPRALTKRWIIQHKSAYFVLVDGRYKRPITDRELEVSLPRDLSRAPVEFWIEKADGSGLRAAKTPEILRQHATVARTLVSSLSAQRSWYDEETETFTEAVCPVRPLEPKFDQDVDDWLRVFFGSEVEKGLDWTATACDLDHYTCALYLSGPPETGKTLYAGGLSRLWSVGGPSELGRVLENFNEDLMRSPLIFADEHIPSGHRGQRSSTELRNLIGNNKRTLNRKFLPQSPLVGAIRLILAANNDRLLAFSEDLSAHDLEAVAERFLHVDTRGAQGFFARFPGGKAPKSWVDGDAIAGHALWLRENRKVEHEGRFLVSGTMSKMLQMLATGGRAAGVVEWIAKYLSASAGVRTQVDARKPGEAPKVIVGNGELLVNTLAVADGWDMFVKNDRAPSTTKVGRALAGLAKEERRIDGARYHRIDHELIIGWMAANQVGDVEVARALIEG